MIFVSEKKKSILELVIEFSGKPFSSHAQVPGFNPYYCRGKTKQNKTPHTANKGSIETKGMCLSHLLKTNDSEKQYRTR